MTQQPLTFININGDYRSIKQMLRDALVNCDKNAVIDVVNKTECTKTRIVVPISDVSVWASDKEE